MKIYFKEEIGDVVNIFEVEMHNRHTVWTSRPAAKEISRKEYQKFQLAYAEAKMQRRLDELKSADL